MIPSVIFCDVIELILQCEACVLSSSVPTAKKSDALLELLNSCRLHQAEVHCPVAEMDHLTDMSGQDLNECAP